MKRIKKIFRKRGLTPISTYRMGSGEEKSIVRIRGKGKILAEFFDPEDIWHEEENGIGYKIYKDYRDWYVKIKSNDPRLPEIRDMMVDRIVRETYSKNKKRGDILRGLREKWNMEVWEWKSNTPEKIIYLTIEDCELYTINRLYLELYKKIIIDESKPTEEIIEEISNIIKKYSIEKTCKGENK